MKQFKKLFAIVLALVLSLSLVACTPTGPQGGGEGAWEWETEAEVLAGVTEDTIWVGNTAGTTGPLSTIGGPFNYGIQAAFHAYNLKGGFNGKKVALKHYDDGGIPADSATLTGKLIHEDEVFAIVGNFAAACVAANLDVIKEAEVPMVYAAAGNDILQNDKAVTLADKGVFPVQPLNKTEGRMLLARALAPTADAEGNPLGGLGAKKVGIIYNSDEASKTLYSGIQAEMANLTATQTANIFPQEVSGSDYSAAVAALKAKGCDVVIVAVIGAPYFSALKAIASAQYKVAVLTSYNNAAVTTFNDATTGLLLDEYKEVFNYVTLYSQAWLDISSTTELYNPENKAAGSLYSWYQALYTINGVNYLDVYGGVPNFKNSYWAVAEDLYNYGLTLVDYAGDADAITAGMTYAFAMSYDAYALAGYIAGDLFCQGLAALQEAGHALTRGNYIHIMETKAFQVAMANPISFADGARNGVDAFALTSIAVDAQGKVVASTIHGLTSLEEYRALIK